MSDIQTNTLNLKLPKDFFKKYAKGKPCLIRIARQCGYTSCSDVDTTVLAHFTMKNYKATGSKKASLPDVCGVHGCDICHGLVDGRLKTTAMTHDELKIAHAEGVMRTLDLLVKNGVLPNP